jgi:hypothetical protein
MGRKDRVTAVEMIKKESKEGGGGTTIASALGRHDALAACLAPSGKL